MPPHSVPATESMPSRFPPASVRASTYIMLGPGATARSNAALRNKRM
jgi:hypothetical protein